MARYVVLVPVTVPAAGPGYDRPARVLPKGTVVELSVAEVAVVGAANLRAVSTTAHDQLGEASGVSNG